MHHYGILTSYILLLLLVPTAGATLSTPHHFEIDIDEDSTSIFIGEILLSGETNGFNGENINLSEYGGLIENPLVNTIIDVGILETLHLLPLMGSTYFKDIDKVTIIDTTLLERLNNPLTFEEVQEITSNITIFNNVDIYTENTLLGTDGSGIEINANTDSAIGVTLPVTIKNIEYTLLAIISNEDIPLIYHGRNSAIIPISEDSRITILNQEGETLWGNPSTEYIILIDDMETSFSETPCMIPITSSTQVTMSIAQTDELNLSKLIGEIPEEYIGRIPIPPNLLETILDSNQLFNGVLVLIEKHGVLNIDGVKQEYSNILFTRVEDYGVVVDESSITIDGEGKLIFLGNHFYSPQAANNDRGIALPLLPIILWVLALSLMILRKLKASKTNITDGNRNIKYLLLATHILVIIIVFLLVDEEISYLLGSSILSLLTNHSLLTATIAAFQILLWILGYVLCSIPTRLIINSILDLLHIDFTGRKHVAGSISVTMTWIFVWLYTTLILNIMLLFAPIELI